jgi:hypothetical protein
MEHFVIKNDAFYIMWYVNLYLYMDLMEIEINTNTIQIHQPFRGFVTQAMGSDMVFQAVWNFVDFFFNG